MKKFKEIYREAKKKSFEARPSTYGINPDIEIELEKIVKRISKNPNHPKLEDDIHYVSTVQATAGLTNNQKNVLSKLYDELMGDRDAALLRWIMNKWI